MAACVLPPIPTPTPASEPTALGQEVYTWVCAECHGEQAGGRADPPVPALDDSGHAWHHPDVQMREWIKQGKLGLVTEMPAYGDQLTDAEVNAVIAYIKTLWSEEQRETQKSINQRYATPTPEK
jgi:mono/diheme cytochrome c family protein